MLNYLREIEHYYDVCVWYENIDLHNLKRNKIKKALIDYLDGLDFENIGPEEELVMDDFGYVGVFVPVPRNNRQKNWDNIKGYYVGKNSHSDNVFAIFSPIYLLR